MKLTAKLSILTALMIACAGCQTTKVAGSCPSLAPPPVAAVDALRAVGDSAVDAWAIALDRHYQKLDACIGH
jgi:hypothetical protein